jgi:hypothetical protein
LDLDKRAYLGIMTDSQPKGKAKRDKAEAASKGVEERMARFEASTAKMQGTIGDLAAVLQRFMDQAEIRGQTYASLPKCREQLGIWRQYLRGLWIKQKLEARQMHLH